MLSYISHASSQCYGKKLQNLFWKWLNIINKNKYPEKIIIRSKIVKLYKRATITFKVFHIKKRLFQVYNASFYKGLAGNKFKISDEVIRLARVSIRSISFYYYYYLCTLFQGRPCRFIINMTS